MTKIWSGGLSAAMAVALTALIVAASGSAIAAVSAVDGDYLIKLGSLSGNQLRGHTLTGRQINVARLGRVQSEGAPYLNCLAGDLISWRDVARVHPPSARAPHGG